MSRSDKLIPKLNKTDVCFDPVRGFLLTSLSISGLEQKTQAGYNEPIGMSLSNVLTHCTIMMVVVSHSVINTLVMECHNSKNLVRARKEI